MAGRDYVLPDDLRGLARQVLAHRLLPSVEASMSGRIDQHHHRRHRRRRAGARGDPCVRPSAGLTVRGRAFLAAGITAIVCAVFLGQDALTRVGVLCSRCRS